MVMARASELLAMSDNETFELIGREIAILVQNGQLQAVGDITEWRYSEVRLPPT